MENPFEIILEKLDAIENRLQLIEAATNNKHHKTGSTLLDTKKLSEYLKLTIPTIYDKVHKREIPHLKVSNKLYFLKEDIDNWLSKGKVLTKEDLEGLADDYLMKNRL